MKKEDFYQLAQNRNLYRVVKQLDGPLSHAKPGNKYFSDTLYERGYNMLYLISQRTNLKANHNANSRQNRKRNI